MMELSFLNSTIVKAGEIYSSIWSTWQKLKSNKSQRLIKCKPYGKNNEEIF